MCTGPEHSPRLHCALLLLVAGLTALKELWLQGNSLTELHSLEGLKVCSSPLQQVVLWYLFLDCGICLSRRGIRVQSEKP
jgi:hypothetical protein